MTSTAHQVSSGVTLLFSGLLLGTIVTLAFEEKIHAKKSLITGTFAVIAVLLADVFHILPLGPVENSFHEKLAIPVYITGIDWQVITIIVGSGLFIDITARSGLFTWIALKLTKRSEGNPITLLYYYGILTVLFSAFLNNVTAMVIVGSLTAVSLSKLGRSSMLLGFLFVEGLLTNIGGLLTLISSVPNIIVGNAAKLSFMQFLFVSAPYVVVATVATIWAGQKFFKITGFESDEQREEALQLVASFDENDGVISARFFNASAVSFGLLILLFATTSYLPYLSDLGLGFVAMAFGILSLWWYKHEVDTFYAGLDWDLIFFFITLFVLINTMEHAQVLHAIGGGIEQLINLGETAGLASLLWASALASSVTDNIPLAAVLAKILAARSPATPSDSALWWSVIFGANLGGNITPIGSASTVVAVTVMQRNKLGMSFGRFVKTAVPFAALQLALGTAYVLLFL